MVGIALTDLWTLAALGIVGTVAGFVDSIAGGGGLLTIPALVWAGLSPAQALATNKLQGSFGTASASLTFVRKGAVDPRAFVPAIIATFIAAALGATLVQRVDPGVLRTLIPILLLGAAAFFAFTPNAGKIQAPRRLSETTYAGTVAPVIGFYDGFFGPGTGSFMVLSQVTLCGRAMTEATGYAKVLNFTSNIASLLFFLAGGKIVWSAGLAMAVGQFAGARLGAHLVIARGAAIVRPLLVGISVVIALRLLYVAYGA